MIEVIGYIGLAVVLLLTVLGTVVVLFSTSSRYKSNTEVLIGLIPPISTLVGINFLWIVVKMVRVKYKKPTIVGEDL